MTDTVVAQLVKDVEDEWILKLIDVNWTRAGAAALLPSLVPSLAECRPIGRQAKRRVLRLFKRYYHQSGDATDALVTCQLVISGEESRSRRPW